MYLSKYPMIRLSEDKRINKEKRPSNIATFCSFWMARKIRLFNCFVVLLLSDGK